MGRPRDSRIVTVLLENLVEAFLQPRNSALRTLSAAQNWQTTLLLGLLAFTVQMLLTLLTRTVLGTGAVPLGAEQPVGAGGMTPIGLVLLLAVVVGAVFGVGRMFGGRASLREVIAVLAWYGVATAVLVPIEIVWVQRVLAGQQSSLLIAFGIGMELYALWILSNFIAAAHGFRSAIRVMLFILATLFLLGLGLGLAVSGGG